MFPDTPNFTDPGYTDAGTGIDIFATDTDPITGTPLDSYPSTSPTTTSPAQASNTGSNLLGWFNLANNIAQTAVSATRSGASTRPAVRAPNPATSLTQKGSWTLGVIAVVFVLVLLLLRR